MLSSVIVISDGSLIVEVEVAVHPASSVTVTDILPAHSPVTVFVVDEVPEVVLPLLQLYVYGGEEVVVIVAVASPLQEP